MIAFAIFQFDNLLNYKFNINSIIEQGIDPLTLGNVQINKTG